MFELRGMLRLLMSTLARLVRRRRNKIKLQSVACGMKDVYRQGATGGVICRFDRYFMVPDRSITTGLYYCFVCSWFLEVRRCV